MGGWGDSGWGVSFYSQHTPVEAGVSSLLGPWGAGQQNARIPIGATLRTPCPTLSPPPKKNPVTSHCLLHLVFICICYLTTVL